MTLKHLCYDILISFTHFQPGYQSNPSGVHQLHSILIWSKHVSFPINTRAYDSVRNTQTASSRGRRYLVSKIQDGGQPTRTSNISETTKHIVKIPTDTPMFSGSTCPVVVLPMSSDVDLSRKSNMAAKLPEVVMTLLVSQIQMPFRK